VRVSESGYLGRRGGVDLMVAMNPQTWDKDIAEIEPGGYLFYDSTRPAAEVQVPGRYPRPGYAAYRDLQRRVPDARERQLFKNIVYVGALSALLDVDIKEVEKLIAEQ
jgi:2-oxoglutarate ferredoxin oxidoreductase subunit alpha